MLVLENMDITFLPSENMDMLYLEGLRVDAHV